ncbi:MAG: glycosyltransferase [Candidatus Omnitrophota bacterium]
MPKISIQICCYNSEKYLEESIKSVLAQSFKDWELVIINDGSTDATEAIVKRYADMNLPIVYFYQRNKGFASARNKALELSRGNWIAILDHDDLWYPEKLEIQNKSLEAYPEAKLHFSNSEWFVEKGEVIRNTIEANKFKTGIINEAYKKLLAEGCFIDSETALIERRALIEAGGFNERYAYIVDYDIFLRLAKRHSFYYEDKVLARWRMHSSQATSRMQETISREYVEVFENALNDNNLPFKIRDKVKKSIVYHKLNRFCFQSSKPVLSDFLRTSMDVIKLRPLSLRTYLKILQALCVTIKPRLKRS